MSMGGEERFVVRFQADTSDFQRGLNDIQSQLSGIGRSAFSGGLLGGLAGGAISAGMNVLTSGISMAVGLAEDLGAKFISINESIIQNGLEYDSMLERSSIKWNGLLGNAEQAKGTMEEIRQVAAETSFDYEGANQLFGALYQANVPLKEMKSTAEGLIGTVNKFGGGSDEVNRVTVAFQQMAIAGKFSAQDIMQFSNANVDFWGTMAEGALKAKGQLAPTRDEVVKMKNELRRLNTDGKLDFSQNFEFFKKGMLGNTKYVKDFANSWQGLKDNMTETWAAIQGKMVEGLFNVLKPAMQQASTATSELLNHWNAYMSGVANWSKVGNNPFVKILSTIQPVMVDLGKLGKAIVDVLGSKTQNQVASNVNKMSTIIDKLYTDFGKVWDKISTFVSQLWFGGNGHKGLKAPFEKLWSQVTDYLSASLTGAKAQAVYKQVGTVIGDAIGTAMMNAFKNWIANLPSASNSGNPFGGAPKGSHAVMGKDGNIHYAKNVSKSTAKKVSGSKSSSSNASYQNPLGTRSAPVINNTFNSPKAMSAQEQARAFQRTMNQLTFQW